MDKKTKTKNKRTNATQSQYGSFMDPGTKRNPYFLYGFIGSILINNTYGMKSGLKTSTLHGAIINSHVSLK